MIKNVLNLFSLVMAFSNEAESEQKWREEKLPRLLLNSGNIWRLFSS